MNNYRQKWIFNLINTKDGLINTLETYDEYSKEEFLLALNNWNRDSINNMRELNKDNCSVYWYDNPL